MQIGPCGLQECLGMVSVRFFFRLAVWGRFLDHLRPLLGPFWGAPGAIFGLLGANFRFVGAVLVSFSFLFSYSLVAFRTHQSFAVY